MTARRHAVGEVEQTEAGHCVRRRYYFRTVR